MCLIFKILLNLRLRVRAPSQGIHLHPRLKVSFSHSASMRTILVSLKQPNWPPLLLFPKLVMSLCVPHNLSHLVHRSSIPVLLISLILRILFFSLTITLPLPMTTLTDGTQTWLKASAWHVVFPLYPLLLFSMFLILPLTPSLLES